MPVTEPIFAESPLNQATPKISKYSKELLYPIPRASKRDALNLAKDAPFLGKDYWSAYEFSWLNQKRKPEIAMGRFIFDANSPSLIESKSLKLYLYSFCDSVFPSMQAVEETLAHDLSEMAKAPVSVSLTSFDNEPLTMARRLPGVSLDDLDVSVEEGPIQTSALSVNATSIVEEILCSDLLKSNCLVTGQPDWGSIQIQYKGPSIDHKGLLRYLLSYRDHQGFAEHCVEQIFADLLKHCKPSALMVYTRYTRRGGLDINSYRSTFEFVPSLDRLLRQ